MNLGEDPIHMCLLFTPINVWYIILHHMFSELCQNCFLYYFVKQKVSLKQDGIYTCVDLAYVELHCALLSEAFPTMFTFELWPFWQPLLFRSLQLYTGFGLNTYSYSCFTLLIHANKFTWIKAWLIWKHLVFNFIANFYCIYANIDSAVHIKGFRIKYKQSSRKGFGYSLDIWSSNVELFIGPGRL